MRRIAILLALVLVLGLGFFAAVFAASEAGEEIVVLTTLSADGESHETRLWVVDDAGHSWLRAGQPGSGWLVRIDAHPEVTVERGGVTRRYLAVPVRDPVTRDRIHALMAERYGLSDRLVSAIRDGSKSVPVRLDPAED